MSSNFFKVGLPFVSMVFISVAGLSALYSQRMHNRESLRGQRVTEEELLEQRIENIKALQQRENPNPIQPRKEFDNKFIARPEWNQKGQADQNNRPAPRPSPYSTH